MRRSSDIHYKQVTDKLVLPEVVVQRLPEKCVSLLFGSRLPVELSENLVDDSVRLHRALDLLRAGVVAFSPALEVIVEGVELLNVVLAEPDARRRGRVSHTSRLAGGAVKSGGNAA